MSVDRKTPIKIDTQGGPVLSNLYGYLVRGGDEVVAFYVDMESKYCEILATGNNQDDAPEVYIQATEHSLHCREDKNAITVIAFPEFVGWDVHVVEISRYTMAVALTKRRDIDINAEMDDKERDL